jgi:hypothetical protein
LFSQASSTRIITCFRRSTARPGTPWTPISWDG